VPASGEVGEVFLGEGDPPAAMFSRQVRDRPRARDGRGRVTGEEAGSRARRIRETVARCRAVALAGRSSSKAGPPPPSGKKGTKARSGSTSPRRLATWTLSGHQGSSGHCFLGIGTLQVVLVVGSAHQNATDQGFALSRGSIIQGAREVRGCVVVERTDIRPG
jgi:hypothetical protein